MCFIHYKIKPLVYLYWLLYHYTASTQLTTCAEFGTVQLLSGYTPSIGSVMICNGSHWGAICPNDWDDNAATVVCRELGYTADGKYLHTQIPF